MIANWVMGLLVLPGFQGTQTGPGPAPAQGPAKPPYSIAPNGLVLPRGTETGTAPSGRTKGRVRSDFEEPPAAPGGAAAFGKPSRPSGASDVPAASAGLEHRGAEPRSADARPQEHLDLGSALLDVFGRVGHPSALAGLGFLQMRLRVTVYDAHGAELAIREMSHEADLGTASRDRLTFTASQKVYGRDAGSVWVLYHGMDWPGLEQEAREELDLFGMLARAPWCFADPQRYVVFPRDTFVQDGRRFARVRIEARTEGDDLVGPRERRPAADAFELVCPSDTYEPTELRIHRANGSRRTVKLLEWRDVGGVRMPTRRIFTTPDGAQALEIVSTEVQARPTLADSRFRPPAR